MFHVHRSNRMEELTRALAAVVKEPIGSPFEPELIVIQSKGMERWLSLELGRALGVWANARFPFPRAFVDELLDSVLGDSVAAARRWSRESLSWTIAKLLPELVARPELAPVRGYLSDDEQGKRRFQLAARIAHLFDQYAAYRPEMVLGWEGQGPVAASSGGWQPILWRAVVEAAGSEHLAARARRFVSRWRTLNEGAPGVPRRLSVFGLSTLPPIYLSLLAAVAEHSDVHLFLLSPSREFWAQIKSKREIVRAERADDRDLLHLAEGNALLASLGRSGRDFQQLLESTLDYVDRDLARYGDPGTRTLLSALQSDVLNLVLRGTGGGSLPKLVIEPNDRSIEVHCCHSPMREVEVLRDQLLAMFDEDPSLEPHDVIVMMPDVERYAPLIDAVFGVEPGSPLFVPYRIADKTERADSEVAQAVLGVLDVLGGRMKASEVLDLLQLEPVRARFGLGADEVLRIQHWVHESGVRWGVDAEDRALAGQPAVDENTWRFGLNRLLLGVAMPGYGKRLFAGTLPYDDVEGDAAEAIGRFSELMEALILQRERVRIPRPVGEWKQLLGDIVSDLIFADETRAWQLRRVREVLAQLASDAELAGFDEPIGLEVIKELMTERLISERTTHDFLTGGVTFCALLPMRSIPFRVVCLLGLSDDDFPRRDRVPAFDLIAQNPRLCDRSLGDEDRYLFLEALLAARDRFLLTYVGRGIQDDRPRPPSVVVGELLDAIDDGFVLGSGAPARAAIVRKARARPVPAEQMALPFGSEPPPASVDGRRPAERIVLAHPLQAFSPRYFGADDDPRLMSYAADEAHGARALVSARTRLAPFARAPLPELVPGPVDVDELARFFENPARAFLRRLGIDLDERPELVADREPIDPDALEQYGAGQRLVERALRGDDLARAEELLRAEGLLPMGTPGRAWLAEIVPEIRSIVGAAAAQQSGGRLPPQPISIALPAAAIRGVLGQLWPGAQLYCGYSRLKAKNLLALWVRHLALSASSTPEQSRRSVLIGRPRDSKQPGVATASFRPLEPRAAERALSDLVELYRAGCRVPLPLFPAAAEVYVHKLALGDAEAALAAAKKRFESDRGFGESQDASVERLFAGSDPLEPGRSPSFSELSLRVFAPLLAHLTERVI